MLVACVYVSVLSMHSLIVFYICCAYILQFLTNIWCMSIVYSGLTFLSLGTIDFVYLCFLQIYIYIYFQLISCYVKLCIYIQLYIVFDITLLSLTLALFLLSTTILWLMFDSWFIFNICIIVLKLTNVFWGIFIHIILWDLFHSIVSGRGMSSDYITDLCHVISVLYFCMIILIIFSFHCISICLTYYIAILQCFI